MRVQIDRGIKTSTSGLLSRQTKEFISVKVAVQFSEEERAVIQRWALSTVTVIDRKMNADSPKDVSHGQPDFYALRVSNLLEHRNIETVFDLPTDAVHFEEELTEKLKTFKLFLNANSHYEPGSQTFEL